MFIFREKYKILLYYSIFFLAGLSVKLLLLPLLLIAFLFMSFNRVSLGSHVHAFYMICVTFFIFMIYGYGGVNMTLPNPLVKLFDILFITLSLIILMINLKFEMQKKLILFFFLGMFIYAEILVFYTLNTSDRATGYGLLFDPILNREVNSAGWATVVAISGTYISVFFVEAQKKLLSVVFFFLSFFSGLFLASRTCLLLLIVCLLFIVFKFYRKNIYAWFLLALVVLFGCYFVMNYYGNSIDFLLSRFNSEGLDSPRFELIEDGLSKLFSYPLGGYTVNTVSYKGDWYHNIVLDTGRVAGLIPVLVLMIVMVIATFYSLIKFSNELSIISYSLFVNMLCMFQDVIMESYQLIFVGFILLGSVSINYVKSNSVSVK